MTISSIQSVGNLPIQNKSVKKEKTQKRTAAISFSNSSNSSIVSSNSKNEFFKTYLENRIKAKGVEIPSGMKIKINSPESFSKEYKQLLRDVRVDIYGARVADMFNLLTQDKKIVAQKVAQMEISNDDKSKILRLKTQFDNYYKIEAEYAGKKIDLINLSDEDKKFLQEKCPKFANFIENEQPILKQNSIKFTQGEIEDVELSEAADDSKKVVPLLLGVLGTLGVKEVISSVKDRKAALKDAAGFLAEQKILSKSKIGWVNPFKDSIARIKGKKGLAVLLALSPILLNTLSGSIDDLSGAAKDYFQDKECFGKAKAGVLAGISALAGIGSSFLISSTYENARDILKARKYVRKNFLETAKQNGTIDRVNKLRKAFKPSMLKRISKGGKIALVGGLFGMVVAACTSGSSWASMIGTRYLFGKNGDDLEKKKVISKEENTFLNANHNMMKYEAYDGKAHGIADPTWPSSDPVLGFALGATGLLTHTNAAVSSIAFATQGCSETLTACGFQLAGSSQRENKIDKEKQAFVKSANN